MQSSNPATETTITGFKALSLAFTKNSYNHSWTGLGRNSNPNADAVIDDAPSTDVFYRWSAVGAIRYYEGNHTRVLQSNNTIPGPIGHLVTKVDFFVKTGASIFCICNLIHIFILLYIHPVFYCLSAILIY